MKIYVIYDRKAETVRSSFSAPNNVTAIRGVVATARNPESDMGSYPNDFDLRCVGSIDNDTTILIPLDPIDHIGTAQTLLTAASGENRQNDRTE